MISRLGKAHHRGEGWVNVTQPNAVFGYLPFGIERNGRSFRPKNWDVSSLMPTGKTYYFKLNGNDALSGLDWANAKKNLYSCPADKSRKPPGLTC